VDLTEDEEEARQWTAVIGIPDCIQERIEVGRRRKRERGGIRGENLLPQNLGKPGREGDEHNVRKKRCSSSPTPIGIEKGGGESGWTRRLGMEEGRGGGKLMGHLSREHLFEYRERKPC